MIDETKLKKIVHFAFMKNTTKQTVYNGIHTNKLTRIYIDQEPFIYLDEKTIGWEPRRVGKGRRKRGRR
jgi:hypothetical protein